MGVTNYESVRELVVAGPLTRASAQSDSKLPPIRGPARLRRSGGSATTNKTNVCWTWHKTKIKVGQNCAEIVPKMYYVPDINGDWSAGEGV